MARVPEFIARARAAWSQPGRPRPDHIVEPGPGQRSVWSFPRPPVLEPEPRRVRIEFAGVTIADTRGALRLLETSHPPSYYLPPDDVDASVLQRAEGASMCEWKGQAVYWSVRVGDRSARACAWSYPDPFDEFAQIAHYLCFYCAPMDACWVGEHRAEPQPGGFYGGWITPDVVGPFKGGPGSGGW